MNGSLVCRQPFEAVIHLDPARRRSQPQFLSHQPMGRILLGSWDQLSNNSLRWYLLTRDPDDGLPFADVRVVGEKVGTVVFPPEPRIVHWAQTLGTGTTEQLPDTVVLISHGLY